MDRDATEANDFSFEQLANLTDSDEEGAMAPSRLRSRVYSALMARMEASGPLLDVETTQRTHPLCVFENLVQIAALRKHVGSENFCRICHARVLAERIENAPIYWNHCPYVGFQNR
jgi:hypothetical protein